MCVTLCVAMLISPDLLAAQCVMALASAQHEANYVQAERVFGPRLSFHQSFVATWNLNNTCFDP